MIRPFFLKCISVFILLIPFIYLSSASAQNSQKSESDVLIVIGQDKDTIDDYLNSTGHMPNGFMAYVSIQEMIGLSEPGKDYGAGISYADDLLSRYPEASIQIGLYMVGALQDTLKGKYDQNIEKLGNWIKESGVPVYLRIGYEFDLPQNKYSPFLYKKTFRYIVDYLRKMNVRNFETVWHSYSYLNPDKPIMDWYPDDDVVDWFGLTFFDAYNKGNMGIIANMAKKHGKPLMLAEASPHGIGTGKGEKSWKKWFAKLFDFIEEQDVKALSYINSYWDRQPMWRNYNWGDARIQANPYVKRMWFDKMNEIQKK